MSGRLRGLGPLADRLRIRGSYEQSIAAVVLVAAALIAVLVLLGGRDDAPKRPLLEASSQPTGERRTSFLAKLIPPAKEEIDAPKEASVPRSVSELARRLPVDQKVAQLFLFGFRGQDSNAAVFRQLRRLDLGGIVLGPENYTSPQQVTSLASEAAVTARNEKHVPPWVMAAQEGGPFNAFFDLPPATAASRLEDPAQAAREARQAGRALRPLGINAVLAPVVDVGLAQETALAPRTFSDDPGRVAAYAEAVVEAYRRTKVLSAAKHFPGLGSASQSTEEGPANVGLRLEDLAKRDLVPFRAAIGAGAPAVVLSHGLYATDDFVVPGSLSRKVATDLLRDRLGFEGIAITDDLADPSITALGSVPDAAVRAVKAGADMLQVSGPAGDQQAAYVAVLRAVRSGEVPRRRLDEAVVRVLSGKRDYRLIR